MIGQMQGRNSELDASRSHARRRVATVVWAAVVALSAAVALVSYRYLAHWGPVPPNIVNNRFRTPWIIVHAGTAATALLLGPFQFIPAIRQRWYRVHRLMGRAYVLCCLTGGSSGLVLAALGISWIYATSKGWSTARARRFAEHRRWMIRSFALTFAAVMLRIYLPLSAILGCDFTSAYRVIAWLAWIPNLILAEWYLSRVDMAFRGRRTTPN
jgi:uncharacterized membrane protein